MAAVGTTQGLVIEDMNGPLGYFGPAAPVHAAGLTPTEQALLLRLRDRLEQAGPVGLTAFLDTLATEATPVAVTR